MRVLTLALALGLKEVPKNGLAWHELLANSGLPSKSLKTVARAMGLKETTLAAHMGLKAPALAARHRTGVLSACESDRLFRLARALVTISNSLGSVEAGSEWLRMPHERLQKYPPVVYLLSTLGGEYVQTLLDRMVPVLPEVTPSERDDDDGVEENDN